MLSKGKKHWKTIDQGKTWQPFETPVEPATYPQLGFHAERGNYILFHGFKCQLGGWTGVDCQDEVGAMLVFYHASERELIFVYMYRSTIP